MALRLSAEARDDLDEIWLYLAREATISIADRQIDAITARFVLLSTWPLVGRARDDLRSGLRSFPVGRYSIFYRVRHGEVVVLRVLHGSRDVGSILSRSD